MKRSRSGSAYSSKSYKKSKQQFKKSVKLYSKPYRPILPGDKKESHTFKRFGNTINNFAWASGDIGVRQEKGTALSFKLSDVAGYTDFTTLYDMYRIRAVAVHITPSYAPSDISPNNVNTTTWNTKCAVAIDYDDVTAPASLGELRQYDNCKMIWMNISQGKPTVMYFTPACAPEIFNSGISTGYGVSWGKWIDCSNPDIPHYGLKFALSSGFTLTNADIGFGVTIEVKYYLEFKTTR